jgi:HD-GYP domain-containing protein (c-di-GMP phosphodiesterase class II)
MFNEAKMGTSINIDNALVFVEEIIFSIMRNPDMLTGLARLKSKDNYTHIHSARHVL